jgi:stage V sporulation protein AF
VVWFLILARTKSVNRPYLWPLLPLNLKALWEIIIRTPMQYQNQRPAIVRPKDKDRQPN